MNNTILPLVLGYLAGNEKMRNQVMLGFQQLAGQGIDVLNGLNKTGGGSNASNKQSAPEPDE